MPANPDAIEAGLKQFRLDVIKALAEIDVEINALQEALLDAKVVTRERLKKLRSESRPQLHKFLDYHAQHLALAHEPPRE